MIERTTDSTTRGNPESGHAGDGYGVSGNGPPPNWEAYEAGYAAGMGGLTEGRITSEDVDAMSDAYGNGYDDGYAAGRAGDGHDEYAMSDYAIGYEDALRDEGSGS